MTIKKSACGYEWPVTARHDIGSHRCILPASHEGSCRCGACGALSVWQAWSNPSVKAAAGGQFIKVSRIPHNAQRYDTAGDWEWVPGDGEGGPGNGQLIVRVDATPDWRHSFLVALHEMVEAAICRQAGISGETVTAWDLAHSDSDEPGALKDCPYQRAHREADIIERIVASSLGVDWDEYEAALAAAAKGETK